MATMIVEPRTIRSRGTATPGRIIGATITGLVACWALAGIGLVAARADATALFPGVRPADVAEALTELGWSSEVLVTAFALVHTMVVVTAGLSAAFVLSAPRPRAFPVYVAVTLVTCAATATIAPTGWATVAPALGAFATGAAAVACGAFFSLAAVFPTGTFAPRWAVAIPIGWAAVITFSLAVPWWESGLPVVIWAMSAVALLLLAAGVLAQIQRYRRLSTRTQRQQTKWVALALAAYLAVLLPVFVLPPNTLSALRGPTGIAVQTAQQLIAAIAFALIPAAFAVAMARYRLFDVDIVIRRTLVAGVLLVLAGAFCLAAAGTAALLWRGSAAVAAGGAAVVIAAAAHPVYLWLRARVDRLVFGQRSDPYSVVSRLGERLRALPDADAICACVTSVIVDDLRYSTATIVVTAGNRTRTVVRGVASARDTATLALTADGVPLAELRVGIGAGDRFSAADHRLVMAVAGQAELALAAALASEALRASRAHLLIAREEERHRLYRDLHDGLGPGLAGVRQRIDTAMHLAATNPDTSSRLLGEASTQMGEMLAEVRDLVHGLRPPALDSMGLAAATDHATRPLAEGHGVELEIDADPLELVPAVEVAAYRIAVEAVTNAMRHAGPTHVWVRFHAEVGALRVRVRDDGCGIGDRPAGNGRHSMRERAEELGGLLRESSDPAGTTIDAMIPLTGTP